MVTQTPDGRILFQFYRPGARQMVIAGDFNGWQPSFHMTRGWDGWWRAQIELAPGTYRFRYLADGEWYTDYAAFGVESGPFGWNSVLKVDSVSVPEAAAEAPVRPAATAPEPPRARPVPVETSPEFVPASVLASMESARPVRRRPVMAR